MVEFQGFVRTENSRVMDVQRLEALVRALEVRVWPWRASAISSPLDRHITIHILPYEHLFIYLLKFTILGDN